MISADASWPGNRMGTLVEWSGPTKMRPRDPRTSARELSLRSGHTSPRGTALSARTGQPWMLAQAEMEGARRRASSARRAGAALDLLHPHRAPTRRCHPLRLRRERRRPPSERAIAPFEAAAGRPAPARPPRTESSPPAPMCLRAPFSTLLPRRARAGHRGSGRTSSVTSTRARSRRQRLTPSVPPIAVSLPRHPPPPHRGLPRLQHSPPTLAAELAMDGDPIRCGLE
jgi:hypothetical protein